MPLSMEQFCTSNFSYFRYPFDRFLDDAVDLGVKNIEIWGISPHLYVNDVTDAGVAEINRKIADRGLKTICFTPEQCIYPINISAVEDVIRNRSVDYFFRCIDVTAQLGAPFLFLTSGWGYADEEKEACWARSRDSITKISRAAEQSNVTLVLEGLQPVESNIINTAADIRRMIDEVNSPCLAPALDTVGMAVAGETVKDYVQSFGSSIRHAHFIDGVPEGHMAWGDGHLPLTEYLKDLSDAGYKGCLSLEFAGPRYYLEPRRPVEQCYQQIEKALAELNG